MKILIYIEPRIELGKPFWKLGFLGHAKKILRSLNSSELDLVFFTSKEIAQEVPQGFSVVSIEQSQLPKVFKHYLEESVAWFNETYSREQLATYVKYLKNLLGDFSPDIILTFSVAPFLKSAFPDSLVLHIEYSLFSRTPFPESWFFDSSLGTGGGAGRDLEYVLGSGVPELSDDQKKSVLILKEACQKTIELKNPFAGILSEWKLNFDKLVLVPLQFSAFYIVDAQTNHINQFDLVRDILDGIPSGVGVIVCEHPQYPILTEEVLKYLREVYPNFLYDDSFSQYMNVGQSLISQVDAVVTLNSSVGLQAILWDIPVVCLAKKHMINVADSHELSELPSLLVKGKVEKNHILWWMLNHYIVPDFLLKSESRDWLYEYLKMRWRNRGAPITEQYPAIFEDPVQLAELYMAAIETNYSNKRPPTAQELLDQANEKILELNELIESLNRRCDEANLKLGEIYSSKGWEYLQKVYKAKDKLKRGLKLK